MTDEKRLEQLLELARECPKFTYGDHVYIAKGVKCYVSSCDTGEEIENTYFSFKALDCDVTHGSGDRITVELEGLEYFSDFDFDRWAGYVEEQLRTSIKKTPVPKSIEVDGRTYELVD